MKMAREAPFFTVLLHYEGSSNTSHSTAKQKAESPPSGAPLQSSNRGSSTSHEMEDDGNYGQYQENVDKEGGDVEHEKPSQPQQEQNESEN
jgi:hypothetical protein